MLKLLPVTVAYVSFALLRKHKHVKFQDMIMWVGFFTAWSHRISVGKEKRVAASGLSASRT